MERTTTSGGADLDLDKLLESVLIARPNAGPDEVRRLAPPLRDIPEKDLAEKMGRARQRISAKSSRKRK